MSRWLDLAAKLQADDEAFANSASSAKSLSDPVVVAPKGTNDINGTVPLPPDVIAGLRVLPAMPAPRIARPEIWPEVVADGLRLASEGWAAQAIRLGWSPLEVFGASGEVGGQVDQEGLAAWLAGRRVLLLDEATCIVEAGPNARSIFHRRSVAAGGAFLWELK